MERRDAERMKRMEEELKAKHAQNVIKRNQAEERIRAALDHNAHLMQLKRAAFEQKEAEAEARRRELEEVSGCLYGRVHELFRELEERWVGACMCVCVYVCVCMCVCVWVCTSYCAGWRGGWVPVWVFVPMPEGMVQAKGCMASATACCC